MRFRSVAFPLPHSHGAGASSHIKPVGHSGASTAAYYFSERFTKSARSSRAVGDPLGLVRLAVARDRTDSIALYLKDLGVVVQHLASFHTAVERRCDLEGGFEAWAAAGLPVE